MEIQHIKYFLAVAEYRSFSRAAEKLFVTQPILSRCVRNLEEELGVPLVIRNTKSFALTDAGQVLVEYGKKLVDAHRDIYRRIHDIEAAEAGEIRISSPGVLLDMYFPRLVTEFRRQAPGVRINIHESGSRPTAQMVLSGEADLGLVMLPVENAGDFDILPIIRDAVRILVPEDHPYAAREAIHIRELRQDSIITYNNSATLHGTFLRMCEEEGFVPNIVCQSMMPNFILDTIARSPCIGVIPEPVFRQFRPAGLVSVPIQPGFPWEIALITKKDRYVSHAVRRFVAFSEQFFRENADSGFNP